MRAATAAGRTRVHLRCSGQQLWQACSRGQGSASPAAHGTHLRSHLWGACCCARPRPPPGSPSPRSLSPQSRSAPRAAARDRRVVAGRLQVCPREQRYAYRGVAQAAQNAQPRASRSRGTHSTARRGQNAMRGAGPAPHPLHQLEVGARHAIHEDDAALPHSSTACREETIRGKGEEARGGHRIAATCMGGGLGARCEPSAPLRSPHPAPAPAPHPARPAAPPWHPRLHAAHRAGGASANGRRQRVMDAPCSAPTHLAQPRPQQRT